MVLLDMFPEIKQYATILCYKSLYDLRYPYEVNLTINAGILIKKNIILREGFSKYRRGAITSTNYPNNEKFFWLDVNEFIQKDRQETIGHEIGHIIIWHYNSMYSLTGDQLTGNGGRRLVDKKTGKEFSKEWFDDWNVKVLQHPINLVIANRRANGECERGYIDRCFIEVLCDEIGIYLAGRYFDERLKLEEAREQWARSLQLTLDLQ